jgi:hypothetical protein
LLAGGVTQAVLSLKRDFGRDFDMGEGTSGS